MAEGLRGPQWLLSQPSSLNPASGNSLSKAGNSPESEGQLTRHMKSSSVAVMAG